MSLVARSGKIIALEAKQLGLQVKADRYALIGTGLGNVRVGDDVHVVGMIVERPDQPPGQQTLLVQWIGKEWTEATPAEVTVVREVSVWATYSSADLSPELKLEGRSFTLSYDSGKSEWVGQYQSVHVVNQLDVFFHSDGYDDQVFALKVTATDRSQPGKEWSKTFKGTATKGFVAIRGTLNVTD